MSFPRIKTAAAAVCLLSLVGAPAFAAPKLEFTPVWTYWSSGTEGTDLEGGAEIVAIDTASNQAFVTNADNDRIDVLQLSGSGQGTLLGSFDLSSFGSPNSVAVKNGVVAVAVENGTSKQANGEVWLFAANETNFAAPTVSRVAVGALPDMLTFTPDGSKVIVANEGEPDFYGSGNTDPVGSVSIVDVASKTAASAIDFSAVSLPADVRIFGPGATQAQDIEPEYISVSPDGSTAYVTLQENNAVAVIDIASNSVSRVDALGFKDHSVAGNGLDASDRDGDGMIETWDGLKGMYQPDAIASYSVGGKTYYVTANEGDARDYEDAGKDAFNNGNAGAIEYNEESRVKNLDLEGIVAGTGGDNDLGRLTVTTTLGDADNNGAYEELYAFGTRSFSIWDAATGDQVYDSGDLIERIIAEQFPELWQEGRSDNKGPEPETITLAEINGWFYALVGLERTSGLMVFDITDPNNPIFQDYIFNTVDISPEGIAFALLSATSTGGTGYVAVANEVSGTTTLYSVSAVPVPATLALLAVGFAAMRGRRKR